MLSSSSSSGARAGVDAGAGAGVGTLICLPDLNVMALTFLGFCTV